MTAGSPISSPPSWTITFSGVTEVVRGSDLLDSTPRQHYLQTLLNMPHPDYVHLPVVLAPDGRKLSKQTGAAPISQKIPAHALHAVLEFLDQRPPAELRDERKLDVIWSWAVKNWRLELLHGVRARDLGRNDVCAQQRRELVWTTARAQPLKEEGGHAPGPK